MRIKNCRNAKIFLIVTCLFCLYINSYSNLVHYNNILDENQSNNDESSDKNIIFNSLGNVHIAGDPGSFTLSSTKYEVDKYESFTLSWTSSNGADNYSLYYSEGFITELPGDTTLLKSNLTELSYNVSNMENGIIYFIAASFNKSGYTLSNCIEIQIGQIKDDPANMMMEPLWPLSFFIPIFIIVILVLFASMGISARRDAKRDKFKPLPDVKVRSRRSISYARKKNEFDRSFPPAKELVYNEYDNRELLNIIESDSNRLKTKELTVLSDEILIKIDEFDWEEETEKTQFINEIIALTPEEREDILDYMFKKSKKNKYSI